MAPLRETIFALSSGRVPAAIAVVRVSGPNACDAALGLAGRLPPPRHAALMRLRSPGGEGEKDGTPIDDAVVLWFPGPGSETGEDTVEFQLHGGPAVVSAVFATLAAIPGLRPAEAGEFTRRAFENGKLDLTGVEGLADLIGAETEAQRRQAYRQLQGLLGDRAGDWRRRLTEALAWAEAGIEFPDDGIGAAETVIPALAAARDVSGEIGQVLATAGGGERLREGLVVAIAGPVNVGKSSILNRLARRPAAIVSAHAGTTRDVIEVHLDLDGMPVTAVDTAGIRDTGDPVEEEGVRRARDRAKAADLVLWVVDGSSGCPEAPPPELTGPGAPPLWRVINKIDLVKAPVTAVPGNHAVSAATGTGFDGLVTAIARFAAHVFAPGGEVPLITRQRQRLALAECQEALARGLAEGESLCREDLVAEEIRLAVRSLGKLVGRVDVEEVLDVIFRDLCIGK